MSGDLGQSFGASQDGGNPPGLPDARMRAAGSACRARVGDSVTDTGPGLFDGGLTEFAAWPTDGEEDSIGEQVGVLVPHLLEQTLGAEEGGSGPHEGFEHAEPRPQARTSRNWSLSAASR
jgi:hypothetical protein